MPPNLAPASVEKVAVNAVMAGCKPEYLPLVLAAVEAACEEEFGLHGLLATTMSNGPVVIVNGEVARRAGMNSGINVLGQGNRANATVGRALQLVVRNVGGGRPGEVDRAISAARPSSASASPRTRRARPGSRCRWSAASQPVISTVTLFGGEAPRLIVDQLSRAPASSAAGFAGCLRMPPRGKK